MKKQIIIATLALGAIVFGTNNAQAQITSNLAETTVNIILSDVISIDGGIAVGGSVDFNYASASDYNSDKTVEVPNSLIVTSSKPFDINVKANGENFVNETHLIPVNVLTIKPMEASSTMTGGTWTERTLTTDYQKLVVGAALGTTLILDLEYFIPQSKSSSADILGKESGTYTQKVTYTATAL